MTTVLGLGAAPLIPSSDTGTSADRGPRVFGDADLVPKRYGGRGVTTIDVLSQGHLAGGELVRGLDRFGGHVQSAAGCATGS